MKSHIPRKRFGQNFLNSPGVIRKIVAAIAPRPQDRMVEIGPGLAALTEPLLEALDHLHVVEIDRDLIAGLKQRFAPEKLTIHEGDALAFDFGTLVRESQEKLRVVGNLPYNISTPLLFHLADFADQVRDMHFMLQKEVVDRMVAAPGGAEYGRLSVMLQYRFHLERLFIVPPGAFTPPPKVDSAIVRLVPKSAAELEPCDGELLAKVVTAAFSQRRKMLRNTLRELIDEESLAALGIAPTARAETLSGSDYVRIVRALSAG
ncbi:16S rRNA (adenine(1518)-N(6)/adenine(1519)-N(6))-dimethyltransferase [Denitratisoma sp. DHT3]|uniref:16S rRNA (adenine(1518)-N(6)/adenine(1519)-N(6))- dimethyltransferase RsmA n=1 Tax=Denitratisoma sp. DHT3 TaxID=1981880 RepID=UPI00119892DE|nr:16S rRNA (adenine(1518)-N(6)/adenine(1519)-N(6))-dimethyltransferase RsmA [Denitratisoma sp. DHT3]QDX81275.1 16S rRNA (adenine(1518)-N(6)/adenine(1519)-N(6))-dimethyltransferase [Denitratisoma sp. DHT3]